MPANNPKKTQSTTAKKQGVEESGKKETNATTRMCGLAFNVNSFKRSIVSWIKARETTLPNISKIHIGVAAIAQCIVNMIVETAISSIPEDKSGMKTITRDDILIKTILVDRGLHMFFEYARVTYDPETEYAEYVDNGELTALIKSKSRNVTLGKSGNHVLQYLIGYTVQKLIKTSLQMMYYSNLKTLQFEAVVRSANCLFDDKLHSNIADELSRISKLVGKNDDDGDDTKETVESKSQKGKKNTAKQVVEEEDNADDDHGDDESGNDDNGDDTVEEADEPVKVAPRNTKSGKRN